jgi:hypothetical protein
LLPVNHNHNRNMLGGGGMGLARTGGRLWMARAPSRQARRPAERGQHTSARAQPPGSGGSGGGATAAGSGGSRFGWTKWALLPSAAAALFAGVAHALATPQQQLELQAAQARSAASRAAAAHWVAEIERQPGTVKAMDAEMLLEENHPILEVSVASKEQEAQAWMVLLSPGWLLPPPAVFSASTTAPPTLLCPRWPASIVQDDHMFAAFVSKGIVDDLTGYYNKEQKK